MEGGKGRRKVVRRRRKDGRKRRKDGRGKRKEGKGRRKGVRRRRKDGKRRRKDGRKRRKDGRGKRKGGIKKECWLENYEKWKNDKGLIRIAIISNYIINLSWQFFLINKRQLSTEHKQNRRGGRVKYLI